jgi:hypothetical protein
MFGIEFFFGPWFQDKDTAFTRPRGKKFRKNELGTVDAHMQVNIINNIYY